MSELKFFELLVNDQANQIEIDKHIKEWRKKYGNDANPLVTVHDYLGMDKKDYADWRQGRVTLSDLVTKGKTKAKTIEKEIFQCLPQLPRTPEISRSSVHPNPSDSQVIQSLMTRLDLIETKLENQRGALQEHEDKLAGRDARFKQLAERLEAVEKTKQLVELVNGRIDAALSRIDSIEDAAKWQAKINEIDKSPEETTSKSDDKKDKKPSRYVQTIDDPILSSVALTRVIIKEVLEYENDSETYQLHEYFYYEDGFLLFDRVIQMKSSGDEQNG